MKAINILWDVDNVADLEGLPTEIEIPEDMTDEDEISDYLSDETGFCHKGFELVDDDGNEVDLDDDFLTSLADEAAEEEQIEIWLNNLLEATKKTSVDDLTKEEILAEMEDIEGTIENERIWARAENIHYENIFHYTAYLKKLADLLDAKMKDFGDPKIKDFECEVDLSQYVDSMLFNSGETIAHIECEFDETKSVEIELMVRGEVDVEYNGKTYRCPRDFPEDLKKLIRRSPGGWAHQYENIYVADNNWFEYIYTVTDGDKNYSDGIMFESELSEYSVEKLKAEMFELCKEIAKNHESPKNRFCPCCRQPLAEDGRCYNNKCKEYDPISQYFDGPSEEDLAKDAEVLAARIEKENSENHIAIAEKETIF